MTGILVGHHSEGRHRRALERSHAAMERGVEASKRADELRSRAASVGNGGISSDDPDALDLLRDKLANLKQSQTNMKRANKVVRKWHRKGVTHETEGEQFAAYSADLEAVAPHYSAALAREMLVPKYGRVVAFESFRLTNNNARIKATEQRISQLERGAEAETTEREIFEGCTIVENTEENRLQIIFDGKPAPEVRTILKSHAFKWAPSKGAWQRQMTNAARLAGQQVERQLKALNK
ncbi:DUF3560 domain-containing protein [uncultured Tateyamaria sp.]|uniref:DUF3560 domain-containing protein n=1 Tax=uncultured Tateyamaria sp. TaxID=455651 RepID=UPI00262D00B8|nr:DUF3560 domain-containing protein [uncultured Tateyamaria sp.]